jgi:hypothetical protein
LRTYTIKALHPAAACRRLGGAVSILPAMLY